MYPTPKNMYAALKVRDNGANLALRVLLVVLHVCPKKYSAILLDPSVSDLSVMFTCRVL